MDDFLGSKALDVVLALVDGKWRAFLLFTD